MGFSQSTAQNLQKNMVEFVTFDYIDSRSSGFLTFLCYCNIANINVYFIPLD